MERSATAPAKSSAKHLAMPRSTSVSVSSRGTSEGAAGRNASRARPCGPLPVGRNRRSPARPGPGGARRPGRRQPPPPAHPTRSPPGSGPPPSTSTASWVAAAAPTDASRTRSWVCHASQQAFLGRGGPAREEIQRAQQPAAPRARPGGPHPGGKDLRLGHLTGGDQDLQRVQQAAIRRRGVAARRRRLPQPGRRLRRPAQPAGLPAGRLEVTGQPVIRADRRRHPVPQRPVPVHQARRLLVQPAPPGRAKIAVHRPLH